jgi:citrate synthase/2-methylcitrate synthase
MRTALEAMARHYDRPDMLELYEALESAMGQRKDIKPNLDYPAGPTYHLMGFDTETFTPIFVAARVVGWTAHVMEQLASNALIRPLSVYNGVDQRELPA